MNQKVTLEKRAEKYFRNTKRENGITLIALAVTIIVMLILAGVAIAALTSENGIMNQAMSAKEKNELAKIKETVNLDYSNLILEKQMEGHGEEVTIQDIKNKMEEEGYDIEGVGKNGEEITGIELSENRISLKAGEDKEIRVKYKYPEETELSYYVKVSKYYHEITLENEKVEIKDEKIKDPSKSNKKLKITIDSNLKGIKVVQEENIVKITANNNAESWVNGTIQVSLESLTAQTCKITVAEELHWDEIAEQSYVGYYADVDGDGIPDGIIYADLLYPETGTWSETNESTYTIPVAIAPTKNYKISQENYTNKLGGEQKIIAASSSVGTDRFYVMSLEDLDLGGYTQYYWYYDANGKMTDYYSYTSVSFGKGKENTQKMIKKWNNGANATDEDQYPYGEQNDRDIWKYIQDIAGEGKDWFIPSKGEWCAFSSKLNITDNYKDRGLQERYWTSSQRYTPNVWNINYVKGYANSGTVNEDYYAVRLSATM